MRAAVLGAGSWGTTFAKVLADAGGDVTLVGRRDELCAAVSDRHENPDYLPGIVAAGQACTATTDAAAAVHGAPTWSCSPCRRRRCARAPVRAGPGQLAPGAVFVSLLKGVEVGTCQVG